MTTFMTTFDELIARSAEHSDREAGLPGRADPVPCERCAHAVVRQSVDWHGACGVPVVRYGCAGDPDACPYHGKERRGERV
jgi:hypothetical protein